MNYEDLREVCARNSDISARVIDDFILYYAAVKSELALKFDLAVAPFQHVTKDDPGWVNHLTAQYIVHRVFRKNGLLSKYLNHVEVKKLPASDQEFLRTQLQYPWRFSFARIRTNPAEDFYQMEDVFTGEQYLLYSHALTEARAEQNVLLTFNLIASNGSCYQTYGPVVGFQSFDDDDIFFFATEQNPKISDDDQLLADVDSRPVPYMILASGSQMPRIMHKKYETVLCSAEHPLPALDTSTLKDFTIGYAEGVFRLNPKNWSKPPHQAAAYFDEENKILFLNAMTERGFDTLTKKLQEQGLDVPGEAQIHVHPSMLVTAEKILKKTIVFNKYERLFPSKSSPDATEQMEKLNKVLDLAMPEINAGRLPDIRKLALKVGVEDEETIRVLEKAVAATIRKLREH